jgi:uncharacterized protein DUF922
VRVGLVLLLLAALGCASHAASPPARGAAPSLARRRSPPTAVSATLDDMLRDDLAEDHAFAWSARRPLAWDDFQGAPPSEGPEGAKTSYTLYSAWKCKGDVFEVRVLAGFRPRQSWVKAIVLDDSTQRRSVLRHEQTHFDLAEVHARRMRRAFGDLARPCAKTDAELSAVAHRVAQEETAEQRRYDADTNHGLLADQQAAWTRDVNLRLDRLRTSF